jgi:formate dehydrogenase subunit gamma
LIEQDDDAGQFIKERKGADGALLRILHALHEAFRSTPVEGRVLQLWSAESCQATGCEDLVDHLREARGLTPDGEDRAAVETVY